MPFFPPAFRFNRARVTHWGAALGLVLASMSSAPAQTGATIKYSPPIKIFKGGTYRGNWESLDPRVPAVTVATSEAVVIEYSNIRGQGPLIYSAYRRANLTVRHTRGVALHPNRPLREKRFPGRFLEMEEFRNARIENNEMIGTAGMYFRSFQGDPKYGQTIKILRNRALNIDGRYSSGRGQFSTSQFRLVQFVQFNGIRNVSGAEIAWNEVVNEPGKSRPEENISMYLSSGRPSSRIKIHNNYIQGSYSAQPTTLAYSGAGMNIGDGSSRSVAGAAAHILAYDNQIVGTTTGIALSAGHDIQAYRNRLISSGFLPDGRPVVAQNVGIYVSDGPRDSRHKTFYNNLARDNVIGWATPLRGRNSQNPYWFPDCARDRNGESLCQGNVVLPSPITLSMERQEFERWKAKLAAGGVRVGPQRR